MVCVESKSVPRTHANYLLFRTEIIRKEHPMELDKITNDESKIGTRKNGSVICTQSFVRKSHTPFRSIHFFPQHKATTRLWFCCYFGHV